MDSSTVVLVQPHGKLFLNMTSCLILVPWYENMTSSTKPEVHNVSRSEEDRAMATGNMRKNLVKFGQAVSEICERIDRHGKQTDKQDTHHSTSHLSGGRNYIIPAAQLSQKNRATPTVG